MTTCSRTLELDATSDNPPHASPGNAENCFTSLAAASGGWMTEHRSLCREKKENLEVPRTPCSKRHNCNAAVWETGVPSRLPFESPCCSQGPRSPGLWELPPLAAFVTPGKRTSAPCLQTPPLSLHTSGLETLPCICQVASHFLQNLLSLALNLIISCETQNFSLLF